MSDGSPKHVLETWSRRHLQLVRVNGTTADAGGVLSYHTVDILDISNEPFVLTEKEPDEPVPEVSQQTAAPAYKLSSTS